MIILVMLGLSFLTCHPEKPQEYSYPDKTYQQIHQAEPSLAYEEYLNLLSSVDTVYTVSDLNRFLSQYGTCEPNIEVAFNNYFQDVGQGLSFVGNLTRIGTDRFFSPGGNMVLDTTGYTFRWYSNGELQYVGGNPVINDVWSCSGVQLIRLEVETPRNAIFAREYYAYFGTTSNDNCVCPNCPSQFEVFIPFYPAFESYGYMTLPTEFDFNSNGCIDSGDLTVFLSLFGQ